MFNLDKLPAPTPTPTAVSSNRAATSPEAPSAVYIELEDVGGDPSGVAVGAVGAVGATALVVGAVGAAILLDKDGEKETGADSQSGARQADSAPRSAPDGDGDGSGAVGAAVLLAQDKDKGKDGEKDTDSQSGCAQQADNAPRSAPDGDGDGTQSGDSKQADCVPGALRSVPDGAGDSSGAYLGMGGGAPGTSTPGAAGAVGATPGMGECAQLAPPDARSGSSVYTSSTRAATATPSAVARVEPVPHQADHAHKQVLHQHGLEHGVRSGTPSTPRKYGGGNTTPVGVSPRTPPSSTGRSPFTRASPSPPGWKSGAKGTASDPLRVSMDTTAGPWEGGERPAGDKPPWKIPSAYPNIIGATSPSESPLLKQTPSLKQSPSLLNRPGGNPPGEGS
eukprot:gene16775-23051_t